MIQNRPDMYKGSLEFLCRLGCHSTNSILNSKIVLYFFLCQDLPLHHLSKHAYTVTRSRKTIEKMIPRREIFLYNRMPHKGVYQTREIECLWGVEKLVIMLCFCPLVSLEDSQTTPSTEILPSC